MLRGRLRDASGIPALRNLLQQHFFSRARLIKASTILRKAWEPCAIALQTLRQELELQSDMMTQGREARSAIAARSETDPALQKAEKYVADSLAVIERDMAAMTDIQREVDALKYLVTKNFEVFDADIECLKFLEKQRESFPRDQAVELDRLFGQFGPDLWSRLGFSGKPDDAGAALVDARARFSFWSLQRQRSHGDRESICVHACDILDLILNELEN